MATYSFLGAGVRVVLDSFKDTPARLTVIVVVLLVGAIVPLPVACAEIILDDFIDPVIVNTPASQNVWMTTPNVGPFHASRQVQVFALGGNPDGQLDANVSTPSFLSGQISHLNPQYNNSEPIVSLQFQYNFSALADFTEGSTNNALFLEFHRLQSEIPPSQFLVGVNGLYYLLPGIRSTQPFTFSIPFTADFFSRGGSLAHPDFAHVQSLEFNIRVSSYTGGGPDPLNFFMELDRICIGQNVPEPSTVSVVIACVAAMVVVRFRCRPILRQRGGRTDVQANRILCGRIYRIS